MPSIINARILEKCRQEYWEVRHAGTVDTMQLHLQAVAQYFPQSSWCDQESEGTVPRQPLSFEEQGM